MDDHDHEPTVIGMIHESQQRMEGKVDLIASCVSGLKVEQGKHGIRIRTLERERVEDKGIIKKHFEDPKVHYNAELADEGVKARLWRKKLEITIITILVGIITAGGATFIQWIQAAGGP